MLNKNDPLIGAVQEVMKRNQDERNAAKLVNEKFGVTDRKALPHEKQSAWDDAYKTVLNEGIESLDEKAKWKDNPNAQTSGGYAKGDTGSDPLRRMPGLGLPGPKGGKTSRERLKVRIKDAINSGAHKKRNLPEEALDEKVEMSKKQFANLDGDPKFTANDLAHARAGTHKKKAAAGQLEEDDTTSPSSMGIKKPDYATGTPDYANKGPQMVNRAAKTSLPPGTMKEEEQLQEKAVSKAQQRFMGLVRAIQKKKAHGSPEAEKVAKTMPAKEVKKFAGTKQKGLPEKVDEGFNNRHGLSVTASAVKQAVADQLFEKVGNPLLLNRAKARTRLGDAGVRRPISGTNNLQTRLANMRKTAPALDTTRDVTLDNPTTQSNMATAQNRIQNRDTLAQTTKDLRAGTNTFVAGARAEAKRRRIAGEPVLKAADVPGINRSEKAVQSAQQQSDEIMSTSRAQNRTAMAQSVKDLRAGTNTLPIKRSSGAPQMAPGTSLNRPGTDAKAQGAKVGIPTVGKPSGNTAQPYGMNVPKKLNPDSRIAKGNVPTSVLPQTMQRGAEQDKVGVKRVEPAKPVAPAATPASAPTRTPTPAATPKASTMGGQMTQRDANLMARAKAGGGQELSKTFSSGADRLAYLQARAKANK